MKTILGLALLSTMTISACLVAGAGEGSTLPRKAHFVRPAAVVQLYAGRTWLWKSGGGYFAPNQRFIAWSGKAKAKSYVDGKWYATARGKVCFEGVWHSARSDGPNLTCFDHRIAGLAVYQRKLPNGGWYLFKHARRVKGDEYNKLVAGDRVSSGLRRLELAMGR